MIIKYLATFAVVVVVVTIPVSTLRFATRSQVRSGTAVEETLPFDFTVDKDSSHTYRISPTTAQALEDGISFYTEGPARVLSSKVEITPKQVTWSEGRRTITSAGAGMTVHLRWEAPDDSESGAHSSIFIKFPDLPQFEGKRPRLHIGGFQLDSKGRYAIREVSTYRSTSMLAVGRFFFALAAGIPFTMLLHSILFGFLVKRERRSRLAEFPPQGSGSPRTFSADPIALWRTWLNIIGVGGFVVSIMAALCIADGYMSSSMMLGIYILLEFVIVIGALVVYFKRRSLMKMRGHGISYSRDHHGRH
jgi:hypothetical protein